MAEKDNGQKTMGNSIKGSQGRPTHRPVDPEEEEKEDL